MDHRAGGFLLTMLSVKHGCCPCALPRPLPQLLTAASKQSLPNGRGLEYLRIAAHGFATDSLPIHRLQNHLLHPSLALQGIQLSKT